MTNRLTGDATKARLFAAGVDNLFAMFLALLIGSRLPGLPDGDRVSVAVTAYLAYFFLQEGIWSNTVGKRMFGLTIRRLEGTPCGWGSALVRTLTRILEANPVLFGGLPAALLGAFSKRHQRLGDWLSGCVVVRVSALSSEHEAVQQRVEADEAG
jgi:uncharacterized RDD family membrane protein YckC